MFALHIVKLSLHSIVLKMAEACLGTLAQGGTLAWLCDHAVAAHQVSFFTLEGMEWLIVCGIA